MTDLDLPPEDDTFVMTALARLPIPEHHPDFWDELAGRLDDLAEELYLERMGAADPILGADRDPGLLEHVPLFEGHEPEPEYGGYVEGPYAVAPPDPYAVVVDAYEAVVAAPVAPDPYDDDPEGSAIFDLEEEADLDAYLDDDLDQPGYPAQERPEPDELVVELPPQHRPAARDGRVLSPFATERPPIPHPGRLRPQRAAAHAVRPLRSEPPRRPARLSQADLARPAEVAFGRPVRPPAGPVVTGRPRRPPAGPEPRRPTATRDVRHHPAIVPPALRQPSNVVLASVAVVAAVMVLVAGTLLMRQRDEASQTERTGDVTPTSFVPGDLVAQGGGADDPAGRAVLAWVQAVAGADAGAAWEALGPRSQRHFGGRSEFEADLADITDTYGPWATTPPELVLVTPLMTDGGTSISVVTLYGTFPEGGEPVQRADAIPVRSDGDDLELEPWADAGPLTVLQPAPGAPAEGSTAVVVELPTDIGTAVVRVGESVAAVCGISETAELEDVRGADRQRCVHTPDAAAGAKVLTVAFASPDGERISAISVPYQAA